VREPSLLDAAPAIVNEPVHEFHRRAQHSAFVHERAVGVGGNEYGSAHSCARRVCSQRAAGVARRRNRQVFESEFARARHRHGHAARLERIRRIETLVLEQEIDAETRAETRQRQERRHALAERDTMSARLHRQEFVIAPQIGGSHRELRPQPAIAVEIVAGGERRPARAQIVDRRQRQHRAAAGAFEVARPTLAGVHRILPPRMATLGRGSVHCPPG
jgi:hypothetical protein